MRKYLGSKFTAFAAIVAPLFFVGPLLFGCYALSVEISGATVILVLGGIASTFVWGLYIKSICNQLYSWGLFTNDSVQISNLFSRSFTLIYEKCKGCGIGFYTHSFLNSQIGTKVYFIYLSYDMFDARFQSNINLWKPSSTRIKVQFSKNLYDYLLVVLPQKQSQMLSRDYEEYLNKGDKGTCLLPNRRNRP